MEMPDAQQKIHARIKIAVLDTGFDPQDRDLENIHYIDCIEPERPMTDRTGHGTNLVNLVLRVYPDAEVFIARIFETDKANDTDDPKRMAKVCLRMVIPIHIR